MGPLIKHSRPTLGDEEIRAASDVISGGQLAQGERCRDFERAMASSVGRRCASAVSSGLAALHVALLSMGARAGMEVIVPSLVCEALLHAVDYCGASAVIVDVDSSTGNIDPRAVAAAITPRTHFIIVPHMFGTPADIESIVALGPPVIEDCALSVGAVHNGRRVGSFGTSAAFSFYATKVLCTGEGGMVLTDDENIASRIEDLRDYSGRAQYALRFNYKLTDLAAAIGIEQLKKLDSFIARRREIAGLYSRLFFGHDEIEIPEPARHGESIYYRYVVKVPAENRDRIRAGMMERGIECGLGVLHPLHELRGSSAPSPCTVAADFARRSLSLPIYPLLTDVEVRRVAGALDETLGIVKGAAQ